MSQPLLSIGMIVKNEERSLEKCLKALEPLRQAIPCELVIADTGSTDKTKEIASKYADILFDFTWVNDFSKARNAVMDKCSGKWFLTVDADEYFTPETGELIEFLNSSLSDTKKVASFLIRNYYNTQLTGTYSEFNAIRMVNMASNYRYEGAIHEHITFNFLNECHVLTKTIFNHDGYANISPEHLKEKERRNLELLEEELQTSPNNLKLLLQCLESSSQNPEKRIHFTNRIMNLLQNNTKDFKNDAFAPICVYKALSFAEIDKSAHLDSWFNWAFENFGNSNYVLIDAKYIYIKHLFNNKHYDALIESGNSYLTAVSDYEKENVLTENIFLNPIIHIHPIHIGTVKTLIANALIEKQKTEDALKLLSEIDFTEADNYVITNWFFNIVLLEPSKTKELIAEKISAFFSAYKDGFVNDPALFTHTVSIIKNLLSCSQQEKKHHKHFLILDSDIGICAKLADATSKEDAEKLLNAIEDPENFMPVALKQVLLLNCNLPNGFYTMKQAHLSFLINDLTIVSEELVDCLTNHYCNTQVFSSFAHVSFIFNLLTAVIFNSFHILSNEAKSKYLDKFLIISEQYLKTCYNQTLLLDEESISCIVPTHLFAWYFIKAHNEKQQNPLNYIKILRNALNKVPEAKIIVEFLIENFKNEEEQKKQAQIKNASPELLQLAEQLKSMLMAFPENSPELLAIKQSPMYKQVAFLIED